MIPRPMTPTLIRVLRAVAISDDYGSVGVGRCKPENYERNTSTLALSRSQ